MTENLAAPRTEELGIHECWNLLRSVSVGRLALWHDGQPHIFPLNYAVDHGSLVFRTGAGTKLAGSVGSDLVALEADGVDAVSGVAWSVVAKGRAQEVLPAREVLETVGLLLFPWGGGEEGPLPPDRPRGTHWPPLHHHPAIHLVDAAAGHGPGTDGMTFDPKALHRRRDGTAMPATPQRTPNAEA